MDQKGWVATRAMGDQGYENHRVHTPQFQEGVCIHPKDEGGRRRCVRAAKRGTYVRICRGLYAPTDEWRKLDEVERARNIALALSKMHPAWVFCLYTAAAMYGLEIGRDNATRIHVQAPQGGNTKANNLLARYPMTCGSPVIVHGAKVTPPAQTVVDCLLCLPFARALAVTDSALRNLGLTKDDLRAELESRPLSAGHPVAHAAIVHADLRAENGGESVARAIMIEQGFMVPELQVKITDALDARRDYYVDFYWHLQSGDVVGELDGRDKYQDARMLGDRDTLDVLIDERHRESRLTVPGVRVMRFTFRDVMDTQRFVRLLELYGIPRGPSRLLAGR